MKISSVGKKVAIATGAAAAAGLTALAYVKGKANLADTDKFVNSKAVQKAGMAIGAGYKLIAKTIVAKVKDVPNLVKALGAKAKEVPAMLKKLPDVAKAGFEKVKGHFAKTAENVEQ